MEAVSTTLPIQMPVALYERIKRAAEADERSMAYILRRAAQEYLDKRDAQEAAVTAKFVKKS